jgi:hypothetical protein
VRSHRRPIESFYRRADLRAPRRASRTLG